MWTRGRYSSLPAAIPVGSHASWKRCKMEITGRVMIGKTLVRIVLSGLGAPLVWQQRLSCVRIAARQTSSS
jgi:hypothetical protein